MSADGDPRDVQELLAARERDARELALLRLLRAAGERLSRAQTDREAAVAVVAVGRSLLGATGVRLWRRAGDGLLLVGSTGAEGEPSTVLDPARPGPAEAAVSGAKPVWLEDVRRDAHELPWEGAWVALPLQGGGRVVGCLELLYARPRELDDSIRELLLAVAGQVAEASERARLYERERGQTASAVEAAQDRAEALAQLDGLLENAPFGIAYLDCDLRFRRINRVMAETNGLPPEVHLGRRLSQLHPHSIPALEMEARWRDVLDEGHPVLDQDVSFGPAGEPGRRRHFSASWYPVRVAGELVGLGCIAREVTAEREAEQFRQHLVGIVSHDLRTPLAAVRFGSEALLRMGGLDERRTTMLERMRSSTLNMERIVEDLLDFTLASSRRGIPIRPVPADLDLICREAIDELLRAAPGSAIRYVPGPDGRGVWDPQRLRQMMANLIGNAAKYGRRDPPPELRWTADDTEAAIWVSNVGPPLPSELLPNIFEPLQRGAPGDKHGTGLGLFIARQIARGHGGDIAVESGSERTVFCVTLPRHARTAAEL